MKAKLEASGWVVGSVKEFLGLSEADAVLIAVKLALSRSLRERRNKHGLSQVLTPPRARARRSGSSGWVSGPANKTNQTNEINETSQIDQTEPLAFSITIRSQPLAPGAGSPSSPAVDSQLDSYLTHR